MASRAEEGLALSEEILEDIELKRLSPMEIVMKASRLGRLVPNDDLVEFLGYERNGYPTDGSATPWIRRAGRFTGNDNKFYSRPLSEIVGMASGSAARLTADGGSSSFAGDYAAIASSSHDNHIASFANSLGRLNAVANQVVATVYDLVSAINYELRFSTIQESLFQTAQRDIDGRLSTLTDGALNKIESVTDRLREGDAESISQAMSTCRRLIDSVADVLVPPRDHDVLVDGQPLKATKGAVLNRLQIWAYETGASKGRRTRIRRTLADLYERTSTGVHGDVTADEARFIFLQTYVALGELVQLERDEDLAPGR